MNKAEILVLNDQTFRELVLHGGFYTLVDFWAEWCNPCKMVLQPFSETADRFIGKVTFAKLNVDENQETVLKYAVHSVPTLILFLGAELISRRVGIFSTGQLTRFIEEHTDFRADSA